MQMTTPTQFAKIYLNRLNGDRENKDIFPSRYSITDQMASYLQSRINNKTLDSLCKSIIKKEYSILERDIKLSPLNKLNPSNTLRRQTLIALHELSNAMDDALSLLRKKNIEADNKRKSTINCLEKALKHNLLDYPVHFAIQEELKRLKNRREYHPLMELKFIDIINQEPAVISGDDGAKKFILSKYRRLNEMISTPLKTPKHRPHKFFFKALKIVIFRILEENTSISKVGEIEQVTADVISEYGKKKKYPELSKVTKKAINNALHSTS